MQSSYLLAEAFFTIGSNQPGQFCFRIGVNNISGREFLGGVEAHIKRRIMLKAKATTLGLKLKRGQPQVKEDTVYREKIVLVADSLKIDEAFVDEKDGTGINGESGPREFDCCRVSVNAQQLPARLTVLQDSPGVPPATNRAVNVAATRLHIKCLDDLFH